MGCHHRTSFAGVFQHLTLLVIAALAAVAVVLPQRVEAFGLASSASASAGLGGGGGGGGGHKAKEHVLLQVGSEYASPNAQAKKAAGRRASRFKVTKTTDEALEACEADDVGCHADVPTP
mmetsp:Transcript_19050/g.41049  ORF Transcript_19050/g.41049 Transcript_19050/m.41049 type:complete len:120 (-) Transcript_19050:27-386(-)|eukprot:CAMPEP_0206469060 /NCGR_PEP_ID=MMETSP0324_2-20121206/30026_1 /ASSEMBLY_ACC=CAM_ASM_000836 /TAXON_ID=2866 /ORGANISM="Crypthecodinium cohnii, Strain Seligo" /LENGTH=119 /DNA_ID=CAMNT_0053942689 /DNA_START=134 /DNA_END=493 /DNA_ORIENTATION=-